MVSAHWDGAYGTMIMDKMSHVFASHLRRANIATHSEVMDILEAVRSAAAQFANLQIA